MRFFYLLGAYGEERVTVALYRYRPGNVRALYRLIGHEAVNESKQAYFGSALWMIIKCMTSGESKFPNWHEMFGEKKPEKEETAEEIKDKILRDLRG